jgi:hypothetical protein
MVTSMHERYGSLLFAEKKAFHSFETDLKAHKEFRAFEAGFGLIEYDPNWKEGGDSIRNLQ